MTTSGSNFLARSAVPVRLQQAGRAATTSSPVVFVSGPAGIGKTSLLDLVADRSQGALLPPIWQLARSEDLDQVILRGLGIALSQIVGEEDVTAVADRLRAAVAALAPRVGREVAAGFAMRLLDAASGGLASELRTRLTPLREEFAAQGAAGVAAALEGVLRPDPLAVVLEFATATEAVAGNRTIVLRIDQAQRLKEDGVRLLADLAERSPGGLRLILAWSTKREPDRDRLKRLLADAVDCLEIALEPLDQAELRAWAPPGLAAAPEQVLALTGGSPLVIDDATRFGLPDTNRDVIDELVDRALDRLDPEVRDVLCRIAVFGQRPPEPVLRALAEPADWPTVEAQLRQLGLLSGGEGAHGWLHELRRGVVVDALPEELRPAVARRAYELLRPYAEMDDSWQLELLMLARQAAQAWEPDSAERRVLELDWDQVATLAAHLELAPTSLPRVGAVQLLRYARNSWEGSAQVDAALESLVTSEELLTFGADRYPLLVKRDPSVDDLTALLCGRCIERLGRRPVPDLAGSIVLWGVREALGSPLERFARVGDADVHSLVRLADAVLPDHDRDNPPPALIAALRFRGSSVALVAAYESDAERDTALAALRDLHLPLFGKQLFVERAMALPSTPSASARWLRAVERLLGAEREGIDDVRESSPPPSLAESVRRKLRTYEAVFELATQEERWAMEMDRHMALVWTTQDEWLVEAEIHGGREGVTSTRMPSAFADDPLSYFRLEEALALSPEEKLVGPRSRTPPSTNDLPEIEACEQLEERAAAYDGTLPRAEVLLEPVSLQSRLEAALELELQTAIALAERLPFLQDRPAPSPLGLVLIIPSHSSAEGLDWGDSPACAFYWRQSEVTTVDVVALDRLDAPFEQAAVKALEGAGMELDQGHLHYGWSRLDLLLASVLGYRIESVALRWS